MKPKERRKEKDKKESEPVQPLPSQRAKDRSLKMINLRIRKGEGEGGDMGRCSCLINYLGSFSQTWRRVRIPELPWTRRPWVWARPRYPPRSRERARLGMRIINYNNKSVKVMLCVNYCRSRGQKRKKLTSYLIWSQQGQAFSKNWFWIIGLGHGLGEYSVSLKTIYRVSTKKFTLALLARKLKFL